ncbi:cutinase family protein [Gordonia sp. ABSL11-1]|uniref:cutinase family protein n=1 Tax=Gordonia sp. ABSL11-1 TaxID=3053924 RepID=UPI002572CB2C|nr:cutinase family protein [Gordonia sp. ABSL11-1]MDL9948327.1 cutinase family protein [Gordonia sp. ABSL11-1]
MSLRTWLVTLAVVVAGLVIPSTATAAPLPTLRPLCPDLYVLAIPGTWADIAEPGILRAVTDGLGPRTRSTYVGYDATAFPWEKAIYGRSKAQAVANTTGLATMMLRRCPRTKVALTGYSQGADAAGDVAAEIGNGRGAIRPDQVAGVVLLSDPRRSSRDTIVGPALAGQGSGGPRLSGMGRLRSRTFTICAPKDLYCNTPREYYVTRIVGYLAETSDPTPSQMSQYQAEAGAILDEMLSTGGIGAVGREVSNQRARQQIIVFNQFIQSGVHTDYGEFEVQPGISAVRWAHQFLAQLTSTPPSSVPQPLHKE